MADEQIAPQPAEASQTAQQPAQTDPQALTDQFKKDELQTAAAVQGVDVPAGAKKADIAEAIVDQSPRAAPVALNNYTVRSDHDAVEGSWVDIVDGPHKGRFGSFRSVLEHDRASGYPTRILVRTRDEFNELLDVALEHVRPSKRTGGR